MVLSSFLIWIWSKLYEGPSLLFHWAVICSPLTVCLLMTSLLFVVISGNSTTYLPGSRAKWTRQASLKIMIIDSRGEIWIVLKFTSTDPHLITLLRGSPYQKRDKNTQQITLALYISTHNILCPFFPRLRDSILAMSLKRRLNNRGNVLFQSAENSQRITPPCTRWCLWMENYSFFAACSRSERPDGDSAYCAREKQIHANEFI